MSKTKKIGFKVEPVKIKSGKGNQTPAGKIISFERERYTRGAWNPITRPTDTSRKDKMSIVFFDNAVLNEITNICLPVAGGSEFQVHYRALDIHIQKGNFEVVLSIPTAFYNFTQEVSSGSVDYELDDIDKEAEVVKESSQNNVDDLLRKLPMFHAMNGAGYNVTFKEGNFGSIHRHPGRFGFSSVDLGKDPESPGVIYRQKVASNFFQTDSVMYIDGKNCEIYTTEARIVDIDVADDGGVKGEYCKIPTLSIIKPLPHTEDIADPAVEVLGSVDSDIFSRFHFVGADGAEAKKYPVLEVILEMLESLEYNWVDITNVKAERITQKYSYYAKGKARGNMYDAGFGYGGFGVDSCWDEFYDGSVYGTGKSKVSEAAELTYKSKIENTASSHGITITPKETKSITEILKLNFGVDDAYDIIEFGRFKGNDKDDDSEEVASMLSL